MTTASAPAGAQAPLRTPGRPVYILSGRYAAAAEFAQRHKLQRSEWMHVHSDVQIRGISSASLNVVYPLGRRQVGLINFARQRGWTVQGQI